MKYTLVSHSGLNNNVELCALNDTTIKCVMEVKGFIFDSFDDAEKIEYIANYRCINASQIIGDVNENGCFHENTINGKRIFVPNSSLRSFAGKILT